MKDKDRKEKRWKPGQGALDLAVGETLLRLFRRDRLLQLGSSKHVDYFRERPGILAKTAFGWTRLSRELAPRPLLRRAAMVGKVTRRKARGVLPVASGEDEKLSGPARR